MENKESFLNTLLSLSDEQLGAILANDSELIKKAQKAINEAKRKQEEIKNKKTLQAESLGTTDPKIYSKALKLVTGPFNDENLNEFNALLNNGLNLSKPPQGEKSLFVISCDYLSTKERVEVKWPYIISINNFIPTDDDIIALHNLKIKRGSGIAGDFNNITGILLSYDHNWSFVENKIRGLKDSKGSTLFPEFNLADFLYDTATMGYSRNGLEAHDWKALTQLVKSKCNIDFTVTNGSYYSTKSPFWQKLITSPIPAIPVKIKNNQYTKTDILNAKYDFFKQLADFKLIANGYASLSDNLRQIKPGTTEFDKENTISISPSRAFISSAILDESFNTIFTLLCNYEEQNSINTTFDTVGRSRLYFVNERIRSDRTNQNSNILLQTASECLNRGDTVESLNAQNYKAKAASSQLLNILISFEERNILNNQETKASNLPPRKKPKIL